MIAFDSTKLGNFIACPKRYQLAMIEGWRQKDEALPLIFGQLYQKAMERLDKGEDLETVVKQALAESWDRLPNRASPDLPKEFRTRENLASAIIGHQEHYEDPLPPIAFTAASGETVIASELSFRIQLPFTIAGEEVIYCGHFDKIAENSSGEIYVVDNKTTQSSLTDWYFAKYDVDVQMTGYTYAASILTHKPISGVIIDAVQIRAGWPDFRRGFVLRSDAILDEFSETVRHWLEYEHHCKTTGVYPMNLTACSFCQFRRHYCSIDPAVRQDFLEANFDKLPPWNPLEVR